MSFSMAKEKAFNRFYCFTVCCWREEAENEIRRTVDEIEYLKQRMLEIEQENTDIADQNEGLKEGAKEGVNNLEQMEEVEEEVETANELLI
jgi:regulator of replication initiation timing